jgi:hypothetical protein
MSQLLPKKNLVLLIDKSRCDPADFADIVDRIRAQVTDIRVQLLQPSTIYSVARDTWNQPTLFVSNIRIQNLRIRRGRLMMPGPITKLRQSQIMHAAGISTPHVEPFRFGMNFDESLWGSHVILKPADLAFSSKGTGLEVIACRQLSARREQDFPPDHFAHSHNMLAQKFIDTGPQPVRYRAMTFMGEVLYVMKSTCAPTKSPEGDIPSNFHSKAPEVQREFLAFPDIVEFTRTLAAAFANWPLLGCDILKEEATGKLYALEVNAGGNVWHISSPYNEKDRAAHPQYNPLFVSQYGAFDIAAKALISATRRLAV